MIAQTNSEWKGWGVVAALFAVPLSGLAGETIDTVRQSADEWARMRLETVRLETAWQEERSLVEAMVAALNERAVATEEKRDLIKARTARERDELDGLRAKIDAETGDVRVLEDGLKKLTARLVALRPALPPRLSEALEMSFRSLANAALPPGERMQFAMNVLNRCAQFDRSLTVGEDVLALDGTAPARSLRVVYWGLSQGYAVDRTAHQAWLGTVRDGSWRWELQPGAYEKVQQLIAIASDQADPDFVAVPALISRAVPATPAQ